MPKKKRKSAPKKSRAAAAPAAAPAASIAIGVPVKVKSGDWGNATGTVAGVSAQGVLVRLDTSRGDPIPFDSANLLAL